MCVAALFATAASTMTTLSTVVGMASAQRQAAAMSASYESRAKQNEANAKLSEQQARDATERGFVEEQQLRRKAVGFKAQQKALFASSGVDSGSGSSLDVIGDTAYLSELDAANIRYNSGQEAFGFRHQANDLRYMADMDRAAAKNARKEGKLKMASTLIGGATTLADRWSKLKA